MKHATRFPGSQARPSRSSLLVRVARISMPRFARSAGGIDRGPEACPATSIRAELAARGEAQTRHISGYRAGVPRIPRRTLRRTRRSR